MGNEKKQQSKLLVKVRGILLGLCLVVGVGVGVTYADTNNSSGDKKLKNGSFEDGQTPDSWSKEYNTQSQNSVSSWSTTATDGMIELFKKNDGTYIKEVELLPTAGKVAAELNANQESTLYQTVTTMPFSIYEWGLDHGARNDTDTMALVIGPAQGVDPAKPSKDGRDQFMQMVDWLIKKGKTSVKTSTGLGEQLTVYSKKFAAGGTFEDNAGDNAFSLTPSTIYTEEWHIWIMASSKADSGDNPWSHYGSNGGSAEKYYRYTVPEDQNSTLFAFVSVGGYKSSGTADKTYGNFLDNINFQIYYPLSGSTTNHGSADVGKNETITAGDDLITYVTDGEALEIKAYISAADAAGGCEFVGVYHTTQDKDGNSTTEFLKLAGNNKWIKSTDNDGNITYTYSLGTITSATDLHFVFIKSPTVTYDANGGQLYEARQNTDKDQNIYSFLPSTESESVVDFIKPHVSHAAIAPQDSEGNSIDGWKFMGWLLTGDTPDSPDNKYADKLGSLVLPAEHTIACDYSLSSGSNENAAQYIKIYDDEVTLEKTINQNGTEVAGVTWTDTSNPIKAITYADYHKGLTLVAQWRWKQAVIPQVKSRNGYITSANGGTVTIKGTSEDANLSEADTDTGSNAYYAETNEKITITAAAKKGYTFEGWYDASGNLITTNTTYSYTETKEDVNTYYARFSGSVTQTYIRQVKNGDTWEDTEDNAIGTLGRYTYTDAPGTSISSTATAGTGYKFVGWYDSNGTDAKLVTDDATLSYTTTGDATYYARFKTAYTVKFVAQTKQANGTFKTDTVGGKVSVASVTDVDGTTASSKATANSGYRFLGWYDKDGNQLSTNATYSTTTTSATNGVTYYARFEIEYKPTVESKIYLSFIAESEGINIPSAFDGRDAGTGKGKGYGLDDKYGNTIATGFKYSLNTMTDVSTIQITVTVPDSAYVKVGGTGSFNGNGTSILTDSDSVTYNKGSIQQISGATTLTYYWDASGLEVGKTYGFIIDNLYAPGATATITVNGTSGTKVTNDNGVVNTASGEYKSKSHYQK